jgi:hypothetical protein
MELDGKQPVQDFVCAKCSAAEVIKGGAAAETTTAAAMGEPAKKPHSKGLVIGADSGAIGASALSAGGGLSQELEELGLRMKAEQASASKTLSQEAKNGPAAVGLPGPGSAKGSAVVIGAVAAGAAGAVAASVGEKFKEEGRQTLAQAREAAQELGSQEAHQVVFDATEFVKDKGLASPRQAGAFVRQEAVKIGHDVRQAAEQQVRETAAKVGQRAHEALDQARGHHEAVRQPHGQDGIGACRLCQDRIVGSDKVVTCPECGATYHKACYDLAGACPQCRHGPHLSGAAEPKLTPAPGVRAVPVAQPAAKAPKVCAGCGTEAPASALVCPQCGRWLYSGRPGERGPGGSGKSMPSGCIVAAVIGFLVFMLFIFMSGRH